jgi:mannose/cellobiose epimerase-like protein (N-acyl-D-glucosamine 2-epimerase family)
MVFAFGCIVQLRHNSWMTHLIGNDSKQQLTALRARLVGWLVNDAYPRWAQHGIDSRGGFFETLSQSGHALADARRARVHPRQVYAFAQAPALGWAHDVRDIVRRGIDFFTAHYRRHDGLFRTLADAAGAPLDERVLLYDQSFALLGYAAAAGALEARADFESRALELRSAVENRMGADDGALYSDLDRADLREANPHMHLLEACLAWAEIGNDASWMVWVRRLAELAVLHFIRRDSGVLGESYTALWQPAPGIAGRIIEPGHQFEWAWLLLRCRHLRFVAPGETPLQETALKLLAIGEQYGVHRGVAVNRLLDDMSVADAEARLWPQTERLKAALLAATLTDAAQYWAIAQAAATSILPYLETPVPGLWFDVQRPNGSLVHAPVPASTFYHLVGTIAALNTALRRSV